MLSTNVKGSDLEKTLIAHGYQHRFTPKLEANTPLLVGQFQLTNTVSDLLIHLSDNVETRDGRVSCERSSELTIGVLLEGRLVFSLGERQVDLSVPPGGTPQCFLFNTLCPETWSRELHKDARVVKAILCLPHSWLKKRFSGRTEIDVYVQQLMLRHCVVNHCSASDKLANLAYTMIRKGKIKSSEVELEGLALTLMVGCLKRLQNHVSLNDEHFNGQAKISAESLRICQYIEEHIIAAKAPINVNLTAIAQQLGVSVSTAQRQFKVDFKLTIMEYIRNRRLDMARRLLQENLSIGEVAYLCGYSHSSNFSLAFKKHFGVPPGELLVSNTHNKVSVTR